MSPSQAGRARFRDPGRAAQILLVHPNASVVRQELTPWPLLTAKALSRRRCAGRQRWPHFVGHGRRVAGSAAAPVAAAGAWAHYDAGGVDAGADADAGDEEAPVGRDVGAGGMDGDVAGPAQQGAVLQAEEVARLLLPADTNYTRTRN
jgi:hypothetical protein